MSSPTKRSGILFILSAPSGAGKSTLCRAARKSYPDLHYSVSTTTRPPRPGERAGIDYFFISEEAFRRGIEQGRWAEWAKVHGNYYGTSAEYLDRHLGKGHDLLLDIDVQGAMQIVKRYPDSVTIFIMPPSMEVLRERLRGRGTEDPETIARRLAVAEGEMARRHRYRHIIVNDRLSEAVSALTGLIGAYRRGEEPFGNPES